MRITIRVRPGSARPGVGGEHDGALVVLVSARAVDGSATAAALAAVAATFGVRPYAVTLVAGAASRTKNPRRGRGGPGGSRSVAGALTARRRGLQWTHASPSGAALWLIGSQIARYAGDPGEAFGRESVFASAAPADFATYPCARSR